MRHNENTETQTRGTKNLYYNGNDEKYELKRFVTSFREFKQTNQIDLHLTNWETKNNPITSSYLDRTSSIHGLINQNGASIEMTLNIKEVLYGKHI